MTFDKDSIEWQLFTDYWKFCKQFWIPASPDTDDDNGYFKNMTMEYTKLRQKYENTKYAKFIDELIRTFLRGRYQEALRNDETV